MSQVELKKLQEENRKLFEAFKRIDDQRVEETKKHGEELAETKRQLERVEADMLKKEQAIDSLHTKLNRTNDSGLSTKDAEKKELEKKAFFQFCRYGGVEEGLQEHLKKASAIAPEDIKVLSLSDNTQAGYLAPSEFINSILKDEVEFSPLRALATVRQTSRTSIQAPRRSASLAASWVGEGGTISEDTALRYAQEEIHTHKLTARKDVEIEMLQDSAFDLEAELRAEFAEQFGVSEGTAFVAGNGVMKPEGLTSSAAGGVTGNSTAGTIDNADDIFDLYHNLKTAYVNGASWGARRATLSSIRKLKDGQGQYLLQPGMNGAPARMMLGAPVNEMPDMPAIATGVKALYFGNIRRAYWIVDRISMSMLRDPYTDGASGQVRFIAIKRVGGQVVLSDALKFLTIP